MYSTDSSYYQRGADFGYYGAHTTQYSSAPVANGLLPASASYTDEVPVLDSRGVVIEATFGPNHPGRIAPVPVTRQIPAAPTYAAAGPVRRVAPGSVQYGTAILGGEYGDQFGRKILNSDRFGNSTERHSGYSSAADHIAGPGRPFAPRRAMDDSTAWARQDGFAHAAAGPMEYAFRHGSAPAMVAPYQRGTRSWMR